MAERASSSTWSAESTSSSSSAAAAPPPPATCWFPSSMTGQGLRLSVGNIDYAGRVDFVDELASLVRFKVPKPSRSRFFKGDLATLMNAERRRWQGEFTAVDEDHKNGQPSLYTILKIRAATCWFPSSMKGEEMELSVRDITYTGRVDFVDELKRSLHFKLPKPRPGFSVSVNGDQLATLRSKEGSRRWIVELTAVDEDDNDGQPSLYISLKIRTATSQSLSSMEEKEMRLSVRDITYTGRVDFVDEPKRLLRFKLPKPRPGFLYGDPATLQSKGGRRWPGEIILINEVEDKEEEQYTILRIRVPSEEALESMEDYVVTVEPVAKSESSQEVVKVGIKGFGKAERFLLEMGLQSIDIEVVAIHASSMSPAMMAKDWNSPNISIAVKDSETLIFTKQYYKGNPRNEEEEEEEKEEEEEEEEEEQKKGVDVLLEHMEVTVFREENHIPWEDAKVDFVVECSRFCHNDKDVESNDQSQVIDKTEASNNCLECFPKVLDAFGLYADGIIRARFHNDGHETGRRAARFNIITSSSAAAKAVCHAQIFPDWNEDRTSMSFLATATLAAFHRITDVHVPNVDLQVTLLKAENCSGIESIHTRFCDADDDVHRRLIAIMSWCLDIIRCMPVGACHLKLA